MSKLSGAVCRLASTPSSDDVDLDHMAAQLNASTDSGDYETISKQTAASASSAKGRVKNTKQVTADARRVLERFLEIADEMSRHRQRRRFDDSAGSQYASETEHQYAMVEEIFQDLLPTPYQHIGSDDEDIEAKEAQQFVDNFKRLMCAESDYVDCQMLAASIAEKRKTQRAEGENTSCVELKVSTSSNKQSPPGAVKYAVRPVESQKCRIGIEGMQEEEEEGED